MNKVELKFVVDIVGHDEATILQMYNDWLGNPFNYRNNIMQKIADYLEKLINEYLQILKTDRYKEEAAFNVDEYYADLQKVTEDLRKLKHHLEKKNDTSN